MPGPATEDDPQLYQPQPALLWFYHGLLLLPAQRWQGRGRLVFPMWDDLRAALRAADLQPRLEEVAPQLYAALRQWQRVLMAGVSDEVRWEQEAWTVLVGEYQRQLEELPVRAQATKEREIVQGFQSALVAALWEALAESSWLPRVQARLALEQFQAELNDPPRVGFLLGELIRRQLVDRAQQDHLVLVLPEMLWETHVETPPRTGRPLRINLE